MLAVAQPPEITVTLDQSNSTAPFAPRLHKPDLLPAIAELRTGLPRRMRQGLEQLLEELGQKHSKIPGDSADAVHRLLKVYRPFSHERDLVDLISNIFNAVKTTEQALSEDPIQVESSAEEPTGDGAVHTDHVLWHPDRGTLVLWESKSPTVGSEVMDTLVSSKSIYFTTEQMNWHDEYAILAKVRDAQNL